MTAVRLRGHTLSASSSKQNKHECSQALMNTKAADSARARQYHKGSKFRLLLLAKRFWIVMIFYTTIAFMLLRSAREKNSSTSGLNQVNSTDEGKTQTPAPISRIRARKRIQEQEKAGRDMAKRGTNNLALNGNSTTVQITNLTKVTSGAFVDTQQRKQSAVMIIAVVPYSKERLMALWSQLECFHNPGGTYDELIIAAPFWARKQKVLEMLVQEAVEKIPHFTDRTESGLEALTSISIQYHVNDRYDVGLWCDSLHSISGIHGDDGENKSVLDTHDDFVLVNDSIMAVERNFTSVLDLLRNRKLAMTSLNYSYLSSSNRTSSLIDTAVTSSSAVPNATTNVTKHYWLESTMRGFNKYGIQTYAQHACVPVTHERWCPLTMEAYRNMSEWERKRCIVENFEISIVDLFHRAKGELEEARDVWGLFPSDVPDEMIKNQLLQDAPTWVNHYIYWLHILRWKYHFPAMKITNAMMLNKVRNKAFAKRVGPVFKTCTRYLEPSFWEEMQNAVKKYGRSHGVLQHYKGTDREKTMVQPS